MGDPSQKTTDNTDAFNRLRVSSPVAQFEYQNEYNKGPLVWNEKATGTGVATHSANASTVILSTGGTASGAGIIRQTKSYFRYKPGKSQLALITFCFGADTANVVKMAGYYDSENGVFLQRNGSGSALGVRSKSTGAVVDNMVSQEYWNLDKMDGTGPSGQTIDWSKSQIFIIDIQWLGVGSVRCGFEIGGVPYYCHEFEHANGITSTYMATANLPIRYEIYNSGTAPATGTMEQICSTVSTEQGGVDDDGYYSHGVGNGITAISVTTRRNVLAIRPKATFGGKTNRGKVIIDNVECLVGGANIYLEVIYGGTLGGSPAFNSAGTNSVVEFDVAGTTVTGGEVIFAGYASSGGGVTRLTASKNASTLYPLTLDIDGLNPPNIAVVATSFTGTATVTASINWKEYY